MRPQSGVRPNSGLRSSYGGAQVGAQGTSIGRNIEVTARPTVMREGMKGMTSNAVPGTSYGPTRTIIDASYYIGLLRPRVAQLTAEIERLRGEEDQIVRGEATLGQLQQKHKSLQQEITGLKATMSDINFALERAGSQDADTINASAVALRQENSERRKTVDKTFLKVKETDSQTRTVTTQLTQEINNLEERLRSSNQDVELFRETRTECYSTGDLLLRQGFEIRSLVARRDLLMDSISKDSDKSQAAHTLLDILKKRHMRDEMAKECSVSLEDERNSLIQQAKTASSDIDVLNRQVQEAKDTVQETNSRIGATEEELKEFNGDNAIKFQELQQKDREMQEFIETFSNKEAEELRKVHEAETAIVQLLERMSRAQQLKAQMPQESSPHMLEQLSAELSEKENQYNNAKITHQRLEQEVNDRKAELQKVATLDEKITNELSSISEKMQERKQEIIRFVDIDGLRTEIDTRKKQLVARKGFLLKQRDSSKQRVNDITTEFEAKQKALATSDEHSALTAQEQKLRLIRQSAFSLEEFVRIKEKDSQYESTKAVCLRITDECNNILKDPKRYEGPQVGFQEMM